MATRKCPRSQVALSANPDVFGASDSPEGTREAVISRILPQMHTQTPDDQAALVWLRRDLRVDDHAALYYALKHHRRVYVAFIFDRDILDVLPRQDRRVEFIRESLVELDQQLQEHGGALIVHHDRPRQAIQALAR